MREVTYEFQLQSKEQTSSGLVVRGMMLEEGVVVDANGNKIQWDAEAIQEIAPTAEMKYIGFGENHEDAENVGIVTSVEYEDGKSQFEGLVVKQEAIEEVRNGLNISIVATVNGYKKDDVFVAQGGEIQRVDAIRSKPACKGCKINETKVFAFGGEKLSEEDKEVAQDKPSMNEYLEKIEKELKDAGVEKVSEVMEIIKKYIKSPYPYPYPEPTKSSEEGGKMSEEQSREFESVKQENEELKQKIEALQQKIVEPLKKQVKELDEDIDVDVMLKGKDVEEQVKILQQLKGSLEKRTKMSVYDGSVEQKKEEVNQASKELFGSNIDEVLKEIGMEES